jgi:hypothetical protein
VCAVVLYELVRPDVPHLDGLVRAGRGHASGIRVELYTVHDTERGRKERVWGELRGEGT